ncbi:MAG: sigma 54-interacting transcriptional regulator [Deltaproteobacteria bacterium]|nr:sigma 54-interacting transcriptional regulator [Deltaproteobacteria bacterium]
MRFPIPSSWNGIFGSDLPNWSIRKRLFYTLIPPIVFILAATGYVTYRTSCHYLNLALSRNSGLMAMAQAREIENALNTAKEELLLLAAVPVTPESLRHFMSSRVALRKGLYREIAFRGETPEQSLVLVATTDGISEVSALKAASMPSGPLSNGPAGGSRPGSVEISPVTGVIYPSLETGQISRSLSFTVIRLSTPSLAPNGVLTLSVDVAHLRNILSLYNSSKSPLYAFPRTAEKRYSYFFDTYGWILFQSEGVEETERKLDTDIARSGITGDLGKPGLEAAFRPDSRLERFWTMVVDVQQGKNGLIPVGETLDSKRSVSRPRFLGYAPVRFQPDEKSPAQVFGGVAFWDTSLLTMIASFRQFDVLFIITVITIAFISALIFFLSLAITRPILLLSDEVAKMQAKGRLHPIDVPAVDQETTALRDSINAMIQSLLVQGRQLREKEEHIEVARQNQRVRMEELAGPDLGEGRGLGIVGTSQAVGNMLSLVKKAASVDADVLIIGETGTGKELAAEAVHKLSDRAGGPFISINCGALDENLLLDALFGHVKGAFSEARSDRKGAFPAAYGGTLHLDEIGNASPKVQQSLLRALAVRRIRPLGSDEEVPFDCRIIAATNADLLEHVKNGSFREDLYYRLKVINIPTPPLREHREDIPRLAAYFLQDAAKVLKKDHVDLSRGALDRLMEHSWPGNIRELKHCITRAVAMAESDLIFPEDLKFDESIMFSYNEPDSSIAAGRAGRPLAPPKAETASAGQADSEEISHRLNARQQKAWTLMLSRESIVRAEYQQLVGGDIPDRTAQHDLSDMVQKGLLKKVGKGPATQYYPVRKDIAQ